jgi:hypothetical protein
MRGKLLPIKSAPGKLRGHSSVKVTEKHYAPRIRERQEQAEADVRRTWARDRVVLMQEKAEASACCPGPF